MISTCALIYLTFRFRQQGTGNSYITSTLTSQNCRVRAGKGSRGSRGSRGRKKNFIFTV